MKPYLLALILVLLPSVGEAQFVTTFPGNSTIQPQNGGTRQNIMAPPYSAKCDGSTDDTAAFLSATQAGGDFYVPPGTPSSPRRCEVKYFDPGAIAIVNTQCTGSNLPSGCCTGVNTGTCQTNVAQSWDGGDKQSTFIDITQAQNQVATLTGSNAGTGGAVQVTNVRDVTLRNLTLNNKATYNTTAWAATPDGCTASHQPYAVCTGSGTGPAGAPAFVVVGNQPTNARIYFNKVDIVNGTTPSADTPNALYVGEGVDTFVYEGGSIGSNSKPWGQDIILTNSTNNTRWNELNLYPGANSGSSYNMDAYPEFEVIAGSGTGQSDVAINNIQTQSAPNAVAMTGSGGSTVKIDGVYSALPNGTVNPFWAPGLAVTAGDWIMNDTANITGNCNSNSTVNSISPNTTGMYKTEPIALNCGAAGALLQTYITAVSSSTAITIHTAASVTSTGVQLSVPNYDGWCFKVVGSGTTGTTPPAFGTQWAGTAFSDGTASLMNYGHCAWLSDVGDTQPITLINSTFFGALLGVYSSGKGGTYITGNNFGPHASEPAYFDGVTEGVVANNSTIAGAIVEAGGFIVRNASSSLTFQNNLVTNDTFNANRPNAYDLGSGTTGVIFSADAAAGFVGTGLSNWLIYPSYGPTSQSGTAGTVVCSQPEAGVVSRTVCLLTGYQETSTAQTFTYSLPFNATPNVIQSSCPNTNATPASSTATVLTLPAGATMSAETCSIVAIGQ